MNTNILSYLLAILAIMSTSIGAKAQIISPEAGKTYFTPTNLVVSMPDGHKIESVAMYRYVVDDYGNIGPKFQRSYQVPSQIQSNIFKFNPESFPWRLPCGSYEVWVGYRNGSAQQSWASVGPVQIMTDIPAVAIKYPTRHSVLTRGKTNNIQWETFAKPGSQVLVNLSLITQFGNTCDGNTPYLCLGTGTESVGGNSMQWLVETNYYIPEQDLLLLDGAYTLRLSIDGQPGYDDVTFLIDSEETIPAVLKTEHVPGGMNVYVTSRQAVGRYWLIESSADLVHWEQVLPGHVFYDGDGLFVPTDSTSNQKKQFFRAKSVK